MSFSAKYLALHFSGNSSALGGAILNVGTLTASKSTFSGNSAEDEDGGGILNATTLIVINSTFSANSSHSGGGIFNSGTVTVTNSTFAGNSALASARTGGADIDNASAIASLKSSILAAGSSGGNCDGTIIHVGYNISNDNSCGFTKTGSAKNGDSVDPLLSPAGLAETADRHRLLRSRTAALRLMRYPWQTVRTSPRLQTKLLPTRGGLPRSDAREVACEVGAYESQLSFVGSAEHRAPSVGVSPY